MKRIYLTMLTVLMSAAALWGQAQDNTLSASISGKEKYVAGKNSYLLDEYKVDVTYKEVMGDPVCTANMSWTSNPSYMVKGKKITAAQLEKYPDLKARYDLITPKSVECVYTIMFYSESSKAYIASAKAKLTMDMIEKAGNTVSPVIPTTLSWKESFTDFVVGKQDAKKPGVVIADAALDGFFKSSRITTGKLDPKAPGFAYTFSCRRILQNTTRIDLVNTSVNVKWNDEDYNYITDEYNKRVLAESFLAKKDTVNAIKTYTNNRKREIAVSENSPAFWRSTSMPYEVCLDAIKTGDELYAQKKWDEALPFYEKAAKADEKFAYPATRVKNIQKYMEVKSNRNVNDLELVYVEGGSGVKSFYMGKTEITQRQWMRVMHNNPSKFRGMGNADAPVENITWDEAMQFVKTLSEQTGMKFRLPRMSEWTYAAKGGKMSINTQFSGGDNLGDVAWSAYNSEEKTHLVGQKTPNELGIYDMTGNVSEWVAESNDNTARIVKGGSWSDDASNCSINSSERVSVKYKSGNIGFRVCQDE